MMGWYPGGWGAMGVFGMVMMVLVWVAIIAVVVWVIARVTRTDHSHTTPRESGRAILDRRFASGEISAEEYATARRTLESPGVAAPGTGG